MAAGFFTRQFICTLLVVLFPVAAVFASSESYIQSLSGKIKKGDSCTVTDDKFLHLPLTEWNQLQNPSVENIISFELRNDTSVFFYRKAFSCTLNLSIKYFTSRDQQTPTEINNISLVVKYDTATGSYYATNAKYQFKNAFKVLVVVNSISSTEWGDQLPDIFRIKNQIFVERKYPFDPLATGSVLIQTVASEINQTESRTTAARVAANSDPAGAELQITWGEIYGAEEYDVEWIYVDKEDQQKNDLIVAAGGPENILPSTLHDWMRNDNSRVTVPATSRVYKIHLPYTEGYVFVRIRGVSYQVQTNLRITGIWDYKNDDGRTAGIVVTAHQPNLNWQYTSSFAEEGKRKEVISYFDGSLRNRQAVTINNSDKVIRNDIEMAVPVVAETIYDNMGRPAANILPAPAPPSANPLAYIPAFNRNTTGTDGFPYSYADITANANGCNITAAPLNTASGASQYYSPQNLFTDDQNFYFTKYVPDAKGKPLALTQYTPDNTGRIRRQGGVGPTFQIGNDHDTKYYYSKPLQKDLVRLFGVEVGDASHYMKNTVVDANGQISVSYIDANGKTIATALAGKKPANGQPANLDDLASKEGASTIINQSLIGSNDFTRDGSNLSMQATATFTPVVPGNYTLRYSVNPSAVLTKYGGATNFSFCNNCYYNIVITVKNECSSEPVASYKSDAIAGVDFNCLDNTIPVIKDLTIPVIDTTTRNSSTRATHLYGNFFIQPITLPFHSTTLFYVTSWI